MARRRCRRFDHHHLRVPIDCYFPTLVGTAKFTVLSPGVRLAEACWVLRRLQVQTVLLQEQHRLKGEHCSAATVETSGEKTVSR